MSLTQVEVDDKFVVIKAEWDSKVKDSGRTAQMFIALDATGWASNFLHTYHRAKEYVESEGLVMPELIAGLEVNCVESEDL